MNYIQRKRTKGWKMPPNTKYCGRPGRYGNNTSVGDPLPFTEEHKCTARDAVNMYDVDMRAMRTAGTLDEFIKPLLKYDALSCWCKPGDPCHVQDVLIPLVERETE